MGFPAVTGGGAGEYAGEGEPVGTTTGCSIKLTILSHGRISRKNRKVVPPVWPMLLNFSPEPARGERSPPCGPEKRRNRHQS